MKVWLVKQHQPESPYDNYIVDVVDSEEKAKAKCREYNKDYAENVGLNELGDWTGEILSDWNHHYYDYFSMEVK